LGLIIGALATYQLQDQSAGPTSQASQEPENSENSEDKNNSLAPDFTSQDVFGNQVSLSDFQGKKPVLLVFWATWCGYCKEELPDLKEFNQKYKDRIEVVVIDSGETKETIKDYIEENSIDFTVLLDEQREIWNKYFVRGTPAHFLINKQSQAVTAWPGLASMANLEEMFNLLE